MAKPASHQAILSWRFASTIPSIFETRKTSSTRVNLISLILIVNLVMKDMGSLMMLMIHFIFVSFCVKFPDVLMHIGTSPCWFDRPLWPYILLRGCAHPYGTISRGTNIHKYQLSEDSELCCILHILLRKAAAKIQGKLTHRAEHPSKRPHDGLVSSRPGRGVDSAQCSCRSLAHWLHTMETDRAREINLLKMMPSTFRIILATNPGFILIYKLALSSFYGGPFRRI